MRLLQSIVGLAMLFMSQFVPIVATGVAVNAEVLSCTHNGKSYPPGSQVCINSHIHECGNDGRWMDLRKFC